MNWRKIPAGWAGFLLSLWPPFWFTGISYRINHNYRQIDIRLPLRFYNMNIVGIQYGGNMFSMTDPCYLLMLMYNLGDEYRVLDQAASIQFLKPGLTAVTAICSITQNDIDKIVEQTKTGEKVIREFMIDVVDKDNEIVAQVTRQVYIRKKQNS